MCESSSIALQSYRRSCCPKNCNFASTYDVAVHQINLIFRLGRCSAYKRYYYNLYIISQIPVLVIVPSLVKFVKKRLFIP